MTKEREAADRNKIVLYGPCPDPVLGSSRAALPLLCVASIPHAQGYDVEIFTWEDTRALETGLLRECADALCVGISAMTGYQITDGLRVARLIREKYPDLPLVWGGWHPSLLSRQTVAHPLVDIVVRGQGERTFAELVDALRGSKSLEEIPGVTRQTDGQIAENPDRPIEDMNHFPPLPFDLVDVDKYVWDHEELGSRTMRYLTSFGCPFRCGFCSNVSVTKRRWTGWSAGRVVDDIERLNREYGVEGLVIVDSNFFVDKERARQIFQGIINRGIKVKLGELNGRTKQLADLDNELWELMEAAGVRSLLVGSESGFQESLDLITKDTSVRDTLSFAERCRKYNIGVVFANLAGLPWDEKLDDVKRIRKIDNEIRCTVDMIGQLHQLDRRHRFQFFVYMPYPGTPLYESAVKLGFKPPADFAGWGDLNLYAGRTPWLKRRQNRLISMLSNYILLFVSSDYEDIHKQIRGPRPVRWLAWLVVRVFRAIARWRWRRRFFALPIDYWLYQSIRRARSHF